MALTVDTIRNFTGTAGMQVDRQGNLQEAGKFQGLKSMLNIGDARQRNAETLTAIHHAILNDPRFAAADVRAEATRLLAEIRTDRAIGAAQIRTIMQTLDSLTLDSQASVSARVADAVSVTPQVITVGWDEPACSRMAMVRMEGGSRSVATMRILSAETKPRKWGDVKITQRPVNGWRIDIENIDPREVRQFSKRPFLEVKTNLPGMESFEVPLRVVKDGGAR